MNGWHNAKTDPPKKPNFNIGDDYLVSTNFNRYGIARYYAGGRWLGYDEDGDQIEDDEIVAYCDLPDRYNVEGKAEEES